jgi:hypothetical protein
MAPTKSPRPKPRPTSKSAVSKSPRPKPRPTSKSAVSKSPSPAARAQVGLNMASKAEGLEAGKKKKAK